MELPNTNYSLPKLLQPKKVHWPFIPLLFSYAILNHLFAQAMNYQPETLFSSSSSQSMNYIFPILKDNNQ